MKNVCDSADEAADEAADEVTEDGGCGGSDRLR